jgi:hypothetical protein
MVHPRMEYYGSHFQSCSQIGLWEIAQMSKTGKKTEKLARCPWAHTCNPSYLLG